MRRILVVILATTTACTAGGGEVPDRVDCAVRFAAPTGFEPLEPFEEDYPDHVGVRLGFRDDRGREVHVFAGIPGEFGEGLPPAGRVDLTEERRGLLAGEGDVWVLTWEEGGRCDPRAVLGTGFSRKTFLAALVDTGLAPAN